MPGLTAVVAAFGSYGVGVAAAAVPLGAETTLVEIVGVPVAVASRLLGNMVTPMPPSLV